LDVTDLLDLHQVDELIVALPQPATAELVRLATQCQQRGIGVSLVPQPYEMYLSRPKLLDLDGLPILKLCEPSIPQFFLKTKRALDVVLGAILFVPSLVVILPSAFVLRLLRGRAFQWDLRCGKNFKQFRMLRLNVHRNAVQETRFERVLDLFSITELPQLWNVLSGEMSLVGPRPEPPSRTRRYTSWEEHRLSVRPGMTGLAQVRGLREEHSSQAKARLDLQYLLNPSLATDLSILLQTFFTLATRRRSAAEVVGIRMSDPVCTAGSIRQFDEEVDPRADRAQSRAN
jgi:lipopolysaccharide/colanic/teichoic acid biosynthesis glycosyltransferase